MHTNDDGRPGRGTAVRVPLGGRTGRQRTTLPPSWRLPIDPNAGWTDAELLAYLAALRTIALVVGVDARWALPDDVQQELAA